MGENIIRLKLDCFLICRNRLLKPPGQPEGIAEIDDTKRWTEGVESDCFLDILEWLPPTGLRSQIWA